MNNAITKFNIKMVKMRSGLRIKINKKKKRFLFYYYRFEMGFSYKNGNMES